MEKAGREMFTAIEAAQPQGVRYASCKLADGETYMILLELNDNENNPLGTMQAFRTSRTASGPGPPGRRWWRSSHRSDHTGSSNSSPAACGDPQPSCQFR